MQVKSFHLRSTEGLKCVGIVAGVSPPKMAATGSNGGGKKRLLLEGEERLFTGSSGILCGGMNQ